MKKAEFVAGEPFASATNCRHAATRLKRLASMLRNEALATSHGLTEKERESLEKAAAIIGQLSVTQKNAESLLRKRDARRSQIKSQVQTAFRGAFAALSQIEDRVALIGAVNISDLRLGFVCDRRDLDRAFKEALDTISDRVSLSVEKGGILDVILADLWRSFSEKKPGLILKFEGEIRRLQNLSGSKV